MTTYDLQVGTDLQTAPPVEFDTALAALYGEQSKARRARGHAYDAVEREVGQILKKTYREVVTDDEIAATLSAAREAVAKGDPGYDAPSGQWSAWYGGKQLVEAYEKFEGTIVPIRDIAKRIGEFNQAFKDRGGWTRAYLVTNTGGHVHKSMDCSTCFYDRFDERTGDYKPGTQYFWMVEYSAKAEDEIVGDAGERACTVCYPSAPAEVLNRPTKMFTPDEKTKQQAKVEREAKRAEREAAKITLRVWTKGFRDTEPRRKDVTWKTVRALQNDTGAFVREITGAYAMVNGFDLDLMGWKGEAPHAVRVPVNRDEAFHNLRLMVDALNERGVDAAALVAKAHKRALKEGGTQWDGVL